MVTQAPRSIEIEDLAGEVLAASAGRGSVAPFSGDNPGLDLATAYRVAAAVRRQREARGERVVGRKIGFTNRTIWEEYDVHAPIWGYVYDSTLNRFAELDGPLPIDHLLEPRIEPEIMLGLASAPQAGMDDRELLSCVEWVAHGFEVVQSLFPGWRFQAADTVCAFALHGALVVGEPEPVTAANADSLFEELAAFETVLLRGGVEASRGHARDVLGGGPLSALRHLVDVLARDPGSPPLAAGEIISTGTLTKALPIAPGETWSTRLTGLRLPGVSLEF